MGKPWFAMYEGDYLKKTRWFTAAAQHGIYKNLLGYLNTEGPMDDIDQQLRAIGGATLEEWTQYWPEIRRRFFVKLEDGRIDNKRAAEERNDTVARAANTQAKRSASGKKGAAARWAKKGKRPRKAPPVPQGAPEPISDEAAAIGIWNTMAGATGLPQVARMTEARRKSLKRRLKECGGVEGWKAAIEKVVSIPGMLGANERGWKCNIDFLLREGKFTRLMEGGYDDWGSSDGPSQADDDASLLAAARRVDRKLGNVP